MQWGAVRKNAGNWQLAERMLANLKAGKGTEEDLSSTLSIRRLEVVGGRSVL